MKKDVQTAAQSYPRGAYPLKQSSTYSVHEKDLPSPLNRLLRAGESPRQRSHNSIGQSLEILPRFGQFCTSTQPSPLLFAFENLFYSIETQINIQRFPYRQLR